MVPVTNMRYTPSVYFSSSFLLCSLTPTLVSAYITQKSIDKYHNPLIYTPHPLQKKKEKSVSIRIGRKDGQLMYFFPTTREKEGEVLLNQPIKFSTSHQILQIFGGPIKDKYCHRQYISGGDTKGPDTSDSDDSAAQVLSLSSLNI